MTTTTVPGEVSNASSSPTASGGPTTDADLSSEAIRHEVLSALTWALLNAKNATKRTKYRSALFAEMKKAGLDHYQIDAKTYLQLVMRERVKCASVCECGKQCDHALIYSPELEVVYDA